MKTLLIPCPNPECAKEINKPISWFQAEKRNCPHCGIEFGKALASAEKEFADLARAMKDVHK